MKSVNGNSHKLPTHCTSHHDDRPITTKTTSKKLKTLQMKRPSAHRHDNKGASKNKKLEKQCAEEAGIPDNRVQYGKLVESVEHQYIKIPDAHILEVPPRPSSGWSATSLTKELWQGTIKVVERGDHTFLLLLDRVTDELFAVCPLEEDELERCADSSRYFILKVKNPIGIAFNERNDAFDFKVAIATSKKDREERKLESEQPVGILKKKPVKLPFLGDKEKLKPPKNDTKDSRRNASQEETQNLDFANFDYFDDPTEVRQKRESSTLFSRLLCCATY
ncbi:ear-binding coat-associated protein 2 [Seminavis robusta]|uniref:Ear-binding coat-associated protein 2 n=1 Tax=Seminavis robusta TaxID=568900 RepID=A0A9N8EDM0_9STRA|nr:ear-binding coat-associated protein 2 [Seminavis robusta]|eukprot:Sro922_g220580.1 ear-binding coat-associated protein 2 (278) ;mRNA; r:23606-24679